MTTRLRAGPPTHLREIFRLGRAGVTRRGELPVQAIKHGVGTVVGTQAQNPAPRMFDHAPRLEHDFLHHRLHAPPLGRVAQWRVFAGERVLTNQAQYVHGQRGQGADQVVGGKEVKSWGGEIALIDLVAGRSTTGILNKIAS